MTEPVAAWPERGPRLVLVHRPEGVMAYTHSHRCWVAIAPVHGVETHQHWTAVRHGHVLGSGPSPVTRASRTADQAGSRDSEDRDRVDR